jgi:hypothetical protein
MSTRAIAYHSDGRRIFRTEETALAAQQASARTFGIWSGVTRLGIGWALLFDPYADEHV